MAAPKRAARATKRAAPALAEAIKTAPKLSAPKEARARIAAWLDEIGRSAAGRKLKPLLAAAPKGRGAKRADLVAAIGEASPYLWELIRTDPDRFAALLAAEPEARFASILATVTAAGLNETDEAAVMRVLRRGKAEAALLIALADVGGVWP